MEFNYDAPPTGTRFLILSDLKQEIPTEYLTVVGVREQKAASGSTFPVLTMQTANGETYDVSAWARDVKDCIHEYGTNPLKWGKVQVVRGEKRFLIKPVDSVRVETVA